MVGIVILAGGKSSRMGTNKASLVFRGSTFLDLLIERFLATGGPIVVVGAPATKRFRNVGEVVWLFDENPDCGPLEGIRVGMSELQTHCGYAFVTGCDTPLVKWELVKFLLARIGSQQAIIPHSRERLHGTTAIYRTDILPILEQQLQLGERAIYRFAKSLDMRALDVEELRQVDPQLESFLNINSPEDYQRLLERDGFSI